MSRIFKIHKDYCDIGCNIYKYNELTLEPGVTVLVGCNGMGKTTLLHQLEASLKKEEIPVFKFDNLAEGGSRARSKFGFHQNFELLATALCSSEGENIVINMGQTAGAIGAFTREYKDSPELWILFDAIDSGLSVDNVVDIKEYLFKTIFEHNKDKDVYIVVSANEYELARGENCLDVYSGKIMQFKDYEDYRSFILKSKAQKDKRKYKERKR